MSYSLVGKVWDAEAFEDYVKYLDLSWAKGITMHHTASPSLAQRPSGFTIQHIRNIQDYYQNKLGWSRGPHLFVDDDQIFGMSPLTEKSIHAVSFNSTHISVEVLGDYDSESPTSGRGLACWQTAVEAVAILQKHHPNLKEINGHSDDPKSSKTCPGKKVDLNTFRAQVAAKATTQTDDQSGVQLAKMDEIRSRIAKLEWQLNQLKKLVA